MRLNKAERKYFMKKLRWDIPQAKKHILAEEEWLKDRDKPFSLMRLMDKKKELVMMEKLFERLKEEQGKSEARQG